MMATSTFLWSSLGIASHNVPGRSARSHDEYFYSVARPSVTLSTCSSIGDGQHSQIKLIEGLHRISLHYKALGFV